MENNSFANNGYYEPDAQAPGGGAMKPKRVYTAMQKWLLLAVLALGVIFSWVVFSEKLSKLSLESVGLRYAAFWLVYLVGFYAATWKRSAKKPLGWALAAASVWLMARFAVYEEVNINSMDFAAIPCILMLHAVECTALVPESRQGGYIRAYLAGWFTSPFLCVGRFFGAIGSLFRAGSADEADTAASKRTRAIRIGVIAGLAIAVVVVPLLFASDFAMQKLAEGMIRDIRFGPTIARVIFAFAVAMLFYSFIYRMAFEQKEYSAAPYNKNLVGAGVAAALSILIVIYVLFAAFQFTYLTGIAGLPEGLTYSEYAVRGFSELCVVASINLAVFAVCVTFAENTKAVRALLAALLVSTVLLIASAAVRLVMYTDAYGLTIKRILSFWFMGVLLMLTVMCAVKLYNARMKLLRAAVFGLCAAYIALSVLNVDGMIAQGIITKFERTGTISDDDAYYLRYSISSDAQGVIEASPERDGLMNALERAELPTAEPDAVLSVVLNNNCTDAIYGFGYKYYLDGVAVGGGAASIADGSAIAPGDSFTLDFIRDDLPESADLSGFSLELSAIDANGAEHALAQPIAFEAKRGGIYRFAISGSSLEGYAVMGEDH